MARLRAIKDDIAANLAQRNLSAETLANRHGISPRYTNMLFEAEGLSVSEFILTRRLMQAHRMLSDPRLASAPSAPSRMTLVSTTGLISTAPSAAATAQRPPMSARRRSTLHRSRGIYRKRQTHVRLP